MDFAIEQIIAEEQNLAVLDDSTRLSFANALNIAEVLISTSSLSLAILIQWLQWLAEISCWLSWREAIDAISMNILTKCDLKNY